MKLRKDTKTTKKTTETKTPAKAAPKARAKKPASELYQGEELYKGVPRKSEQEVSDSTRIGLSLPNDLLELADDFVYQKKKDDKGYSRSQLIQDALRAYLP